MEIALPTQEFVVNEIPIELSGIQIQVDGDIEHVPAQGEDVHWQGNPLAVSININSFEVSQTVEQWIDGIRVIVHLSAQCQAVNLHQSSAALNVALSWISDQTSLRAIVSGIDLSWPLDSWVVSPISCEGPRGFADVVEQELTEQLSNPAQWVPLLKSEIESHLNAKVEETLQKYRNPTPIYSDSQTQLKLKLSKVDTITKDGLVIKGFVLVGDKENSTQAYEIIPLDVEKAMANIRTTTPLLLIPGNGLASVTRQVLSHREFNFNLRSISEFNSLLNFRLFQFFIWPDLMNYSTRASFPVISRIGAKPKVSYSSYRIYAEGSANSWVYSSRAGYAWRYIDVQTGFSARILPKIENGKLNLGFEQRSVNSSAQMAPDYTRAFRPRTYLPMSVINAALENSPAFKNVEVDLPKIQLDGDTEYSAHRMHYLIEDTYIVELRSK